MSSRGKQLVNLCFDALRRKPKNQKKKSEVYKDEKGNTNRNEDQKKKKNLPEKYSRPKQRNETTVDMLGLFDAGEWDNFQERLNTSLREIETLKELKHKNGQNNGIDGNSNKASTGQDGLYETDGVEKYPSEDIDLCKSSKETEPINDESNDIDGNINNTPFGPESLYESDEVAVYPTEDINFRKSTDETENTNSSPECDIPVLPSTPNYLELTIEELNGTPVENLLQLLESKNDAEEEIDPSVKEILFGIELDATDEINWNIDNIEDADEGCSQVGKNVRKSLFEQGISDGTDSFHNNGDVRTLDSSHDQKHIDEGCRQFSGDVKNKNFEDESPDNIYTAEKSADIGVQESTEDINLQNIEKDFEETHSLSEPKERKKNACPFCDPITLINCSNYCRHLLRNHSGNMEVERMNSLPKGSSERRTLLAEIRNKGNFLYNSSKSPFFVSSRRPLKEQSPKKTNYVTCMHCLVFVKRKNFFLHRKICKKFDKNIVECNFCKTTVAEGHLSKHLKHKCTKNDKFTVGTEINLNKSRKQRRVLQSCSLFVSKDLVGASEDLTKNVLPLLRIDEVSEIIKDDPLILEVGSKLRSNHKENHSKHDIISKMRPLGQIVQIMRKMNVKIRTFKDCLRCQNVQLLFKTVQQMSGYDEETGIVKIPSMPSRIKGPLSLALQVVKNNVRCNANLSYETKKELLFDYQSTEDIIRTDWRFVISTNAQKSLNENHRNKGILMPLEEDIKAASKYLTDQEELLLGKLKENADPHIYESLCEAVIADIIIFNCRRAGEVARAGVKHYLDRSSIEFEGDLKAVLSDSELKAKDSLTMFYVPGKRDRTVPILLTQTMKKCVDVIVAMRSEMDVSNNPLLFPRLYSDKPYDSCMIIRELKKKIPLKKPDHFTSTGLRHEIATHSHLQDADRPGYRKILFSHMGHTEAVHNDKYVTPLPVLQISKVGSNLLKRRSGNALSDHKSTTLVHERDKKNTSHISCTQEVFLPGISAPDSLPNYQLTDLPSSYVEQLEPLPKKKKKIHTPCLLARDDNISSDPTAYISQDEVCLLDISSDPDFLPNNQATDSSSSFSVQMETTPKRKNKKRHIAWTLAEQKCVVYTFRDFFKNKKTPGRKLCENLIAAENCLKNRTWQQLNAFVENVNRKRKKLLPQLANTLIN